MVNSEKMTTFNRTTQSLQATPDLSNHSLHETKERSENIGKKSSFKTFGCLVNDPEKREIATESAISSKEDIMRQNLERHNSPLGEPKDRKLENRLQQQRLFQRDSS